MGENDDRKLMRRCIDLANKARGKTYPNPLVGSVIVYQNNIIGEGYHLKAGAPHAEANAISSVRNKALLPLSTIYVNLEPCSHFGKTPPCADLIISTGIKKVVIGTIDTSEKVLGKGVAKLRNAGCEVITGVLENECRWINRRFLTFNEERRPYIILKWAQSADGYIDIIRDDRHERKPTWITGTGEKALVHKWRSEEQSILVGSGTIKADNPLLNVRNWTGNDPLRIILTGSGLIDRRSNVFMTNGTNIVFTYNAESEFDNATKVVLRREEGTARQIVKWLYDSGIQSLIIEGGAMVLREFINAGLWDEARIFHGNMNFADGISAVAIEGRRLRKIKMKESMLEYVLNEAGRFSNTIDNYN